MPDIIRPSMPTQIPVQTQGIENKTYSTGDNLNASGVNFSNATNNAIGSFSQSYNNSNTSVIGSSLSGAASGAAIGSVIPGLGTGVGAIIGALGGMFGALGKNRKAKKEREYNEKQVQKQMDFNAEQAELAHKRNLEAMQKQADLNQSNYDQNYSYSAQVEAMKKAGISPASMYNTGIQGQSSSASALSSPSASSSAAASTPISSDADLQNAATTSAHLQLDALSVGANNTRTLADAARISIDNQTANQRNVSEILKNYAEIEKLRKSGLLDDASANKILTMLSHEIENVDQNSRLTSITADNTEIVMKSTAANNYASVNEKNVHSGLMAQQTISEKRNSELMRLSTYQKSLEWTNEKNKYLITRDICKEYNIDPRYSGYVENLISSVAQQSGVDLVNISAKTLFSWLDFSNWKSIFSTKMYTNAQRDISDAQIANARESLEKTLAERYYADDKNFELGQANLDEKKREFDLTSERISASKDNERQHYLDDLKARGTSALNRLNPKDQKMVKDLYAQDPIAAYHLAIDLANKYPK